MNIETQDLSETRKTLVTSFETAEMAAEHQAVVAEFTKLAQIPGFRPGKAPAALVQKRFGKKITEEFRQKIMTKAYEASIKDAQLEVLNVIKVEEVEITPDAPATITVTVDVQPQFELPEWQGLPVSANPVEASDEEVDQAVDALRAEQVDFSVVERPAQRTDYVKLAYEGTVDGTPILELAPDKQVYGKGPQTWEEVEGENEGLIPGLGRHLGGLKAGDKRDIDIEFPADFTAVETLAGKKAVYAVEVLEVRERVLPEIDEAFLKANRAADLAEFKGRVRDGIRHRKESRNRLEQRNQITEALIEKVSFQPPDSLVESETQSVSQRLIEENLRQGASAEDLEPIKAKLYDNARKIAENRVISQLVLAKIAEQAKVTVEEDDLKQFIYSQAMRSGQAPDVFVKELTKNEEHLRSIRQSILLDKTLDLVVAKATVQETETDAAAP